MDKNQKIPWPRVLVEAGAIVVSILLAFGIEAWWSDRQQSQDETAILTAIVDELRMVQRSLRDGDIKVGAIRESAQKMIASGIGLGDPLDDREIDVLISDLTWYTSPEEVDTPELESLLSSGDLALISDRELRGKIGSLQYLLESTRAVIQRDLDFFNKIQVPFLIKHTVLQQIWNIGQHRPGFPNINFPSILEVPLRETVSHRSLLENREFQSILAQRARSLVDIQMWSSAGVEESVAEVIQLIELELDD